MRKGWEMKKLGDLYDITSSKRVFESEWTRQGVPFYRAREIVKLAKHGYVENELFISEEMYNEYAKKYSIPKEGDIMVTGVGTLGICYVVKKNDRFYFKDGNIIWLKKRDNINSHYVEYAFKSDFLRKQIDDSVGATVGTYTIIRAKNTDIPIAPLSEQKRIVAILDEAFAAIDQAKANSQKNLQNAKDLFESYLQNVFAEKGEDSASSKATADKWEEKTLAEIAFVKSGGTPSRSRKEYWTGNIPWYSSGELNDLYTKDPERFINDLAINNSNAKLFPKGSLLIGMYDTAALKMSIIDRDATFNQAIAGVKPNKSIDLKFILHSVNAIKPDLLNLRRGVRQKNLSLEKIKSIPIFLPSIKTQKLVVAKLTNLSVETKRLESIYQQKLNDLDELKKSILQKAFAGELTL